MKKRETRKEGNRKWNSRYVLLAVLMTAVLLSLQGCSSSDSGSKNMAEMDMGMSTADDSTADEIYMDSTADGNGTETETADTGNGAMADSKLPEESSQRENYGQKLIRNFYIELETKDFDQVNKQVMAEVKELGGYVESSSTTKDNGYGTRYGNYILRIPKEKVDGFLETVNASGNVTSSSENTQDITLTYADTANRKKALEIEQERLLAMMEKAEKLKDLLDLEERLTEVRYQLEAYGSELRGYDNQVDYCTVTLNIQEVESETPVKEASVGEKMSSGLEKTICDIKEGLTELSIFLVTKLPYIIIWVIFAVVVIIIVKKSRKYSKKRREERLKQREQMRQNQMTGNPQPGQMVSNTVPQSETSVKSEVNEGNQPDKK